MKAPSEAASPAPNESAPSNFLRDRMIEDIRTRKYGDPVIQSAPRQNATSLDRLI